MAIPSVLQQHLHKLTDYISVWNWLSNLLEKSLTPAAQGINKIQFVPPEKQLLNRNT